MSMSGLSLLRKGKSSRGLRLQLFLLLGFLGTSLVVLLAPLRVSAQDSDPGDSGTAVEPEQTADEPQADSPTDSDGTASDQYWGPAAGLGPDYQVGAGDVIAVDVFNVKDLSHLKRRIGNDGTVSLPLLGDVKVAGLSTQKIQEELEELWGKTYLQDPQVSVFVLQFKARPVSVIGAVSKPGLYPLTARRTLVDVLSMAGGLGNKVSSTAPGRTVIITRQGGFGNLAMSDGMHLLAPDKLEIDLSKLLYSSDNSTNIEIKPLDTISVTKAPVIYVVGEVKKAGGFVLQDREKVTVLQALALAEGLHGNPAKKYARIIRDDPNGHREVIPINLGKIMKGKAADPEMIASDILFIPESAGKAAIKQATSSAVATISGLIIWGKF